VNELRLFAAVTFWIPEANRVCVYEKQTLLADGLSLSAKTVMLKNLK